MRVEWAPGSLRDRDDIFAFVGADNRDAAVAIDEQIENQVDLLTQFPRSGRLGRVAGTRELVIQHTPYIVAYRIRGQRVRILRVLHGAQHWPKSL